MQRYVSIPIMLALIFGFGPGARAHLCDNVFRQADKLIVKPETYNIVVKDKTTFKVFLQNNMDRGISEISLVGDSAVFDFEITPKKMSIPTDQRAYFEVAMMPKSGTKTGNYPVNFRLVGGGKLFKSFSLNTDSSGQGKVAKTAAPPVGPSSVSTAAPPQAAKSEPVAKASGIARARFVSSPPEIDGNLNDPTWKTAVVLANFTAAGGGQAIYDTTVLMQYDQDNIYFGVFCNDQDAQALTDADSIEVQLSRHPSGRPYYSFTLGPTEKVALKQILADGTVVAWPVNNAAFRVDRSGRSWSAEIALPFAALSIQAPATPQKAYLRVNRTKAGGNAEKSYWSAGPSGYNNEQGMGEVLFQP